MLTLSTQYPLIVKFIVNHNTRTKKNRFIFFNILDKSCKKMLSSDSKNLTFFSANATGRFISHNYGTRTHATNVDSPFKIFEIALVLMFLFGLIGNVLSILVMRTKRMRNTNASIFIILISILDSLFLFFRNIAMFYKKYDWYHNDKTCLITNSMTVIAQVCSF